MYKNKSPYSHNYARISSSPGMFAQVLSQKGRMDKQNSSQKYFYDDSCRTNNGMRKKQTEEDISLECDEILIPNRSSKNFQTNKYQETVEKNSLRIKRAVTKKQQSSYQFDLMCTEQLRKQSPEKPKPTLVDFQTLFYRTANLLNFYQTKVLELESKLLNQK